VTRVPVAGGAPVADGPDWLARAARDPDVVAEAARALVRLVAAQRVATAEPLPDPDPARALATRVGYGSGPQVAEGEWEDALELAPGAGPRGRRRAPAGTDRLAGLLSGRDVALACEELTLRARADLDHDRPREAALQLEAALRAALAELAGWREQGDLEQRLAELAGYAPPVAAAAAAAREGRLDPAGVETVGAALARLEAALRARAVYGG
jgi:CBS domain-containing protein